MPDRRSELTEIVRQRILSGLHLGVLRPGDRLPSTRAVADEFGVAKRTVMSAYELLEAEGIVELRERSGIFVAPGEGSETIMLTQLAGWVVDVLLDARSREIPPIGFPERVRRCLETLRVRAVCVADNADQWEQICFELSNDYGIETEPLHVSRLATPDADAQRALTRTDLIVTTSLCAAQSQRAAAHLGKPAITVALRQDLMGELTRQLADGPVYLIGSDPRFRDAVQAVFGPTGHGANMRVVILDEDEPRLIPPDAPVYVMGRAHRLLADDAFARRVTPIRRVFSRDMARELLTFIIRANIAAMSARSD